MSERYAIYFCPAEQSPLYRVAAAWLGYDVYTAKALPSNAEAIAQLGDASYQAAIKRPAHYGFHATLKPPFRLAQGCERAELIKAVGDFALNQAPIDLGQLQLSALGRFMALCLAQPNPALAQLAQDCVAHFEPFRAPLSEAEYQKRQPDKLSATQRRNLEQWGYPFVFDEFRFHCTLTSKLTPAQQAQVEPVLATLFDEVLKQAVPLNQLHLYHQADSKSPFRVLQSFDLTATTA